MIKKLLKKLTPKFALSWYHYFLAFCGALFFAFPSNDLIVIGVTGTSGKSTTTDLITRILEESGSKVASISTIRFKIADRVWNNSLKMTMPGRFTIQKFLWQARKQGCKYVVLEVSSEGVRQFRHKFINFKIAVFTNLSKEHIESHGGFENYRNEKLKFFKAVKNTHIINVDDQNAEYFYNIKADKKVGFGFDKNNKWVNVVGQNIFAGQTGVSFQVENVDFNLNLQGEFNAKNALAAICVALSEGVSLQVCKKALEKAKGIEGRMEVVTTSPFKVVVDYAHTPEQLESVYKALKTTGSELVCVLGSCGGGRDKWKRPFLGEIASNYCNHIIVTNEDPYDEDPQTIIQQVSAGVKNNKSAEKILDRRQAIARALNLAKPGETVVITGKGSENLMCLANGKKIPWSDKEIARAELNKIQK